MDNTYVKSDKVVLTGRLAEFREALEDEIKEIEKSGQSSTLLFGGRKVEGSGGGEFSYRFRVEYLSAMPADTPCKLIIGKDSYDVIVISFEETFITIASKEELPDTLAKARLENGIKVLLERLIKRIEDNNLKTNPVGERILKTSDTSITDTYKCISNDVDFHPNSKNNNAQNKAITSALTNNITYIWGPPGTGKTMVIGQIINELLNRNRSVLLVSHTNVAVDGAIKIVDEKYDEAHKDRDEKELYPILRMGSRSPLIELEDRIQLKAHISILGKGLYARKEELEKQKAEYQDRLDVIILQINKSKWAQQNRLAYAPSLLSKIEQLDGEIRVLHQEEDDVLEKLKNLETELSQYKKYRRTQENLRLKEKEYSNLKIHYDNAISDIESIPGKIQTAKDELVKHEKYLELKALEAHQLSISEQENQIIQIKVQIESLQKEEKTLTIEQTSLEKKLNEYNNKGAFSKLLVGKSSITHDAERRSDISTRLAGIQVILKAKVLILQRYEKQLIESVATQEQLKANTLIETKEDLKIKLQSMTAQIEHSRYVIPDLQQALSQVEDELQELRVEFNTIKIAHDVINEINNRLAEIETRLKQKQGMQSEIKNECANVFEDEKVQCERFGYFCDETNPNDIYNELDELLQQVKTELDNIDLQALETEDKGIRGKIITILIEMSEIEQKMHELERQVIMQAKVIGTTLTKSYLSDILQERSFDTVILDEASTASIPALWCASCLAEKNIVIIGDFKQLSPIVMAETDYAKKWLGIDVFMHSGMQARVGIGKKPPNNFVVLDEQYRMEEEIADIANLYYKEQGVRLKSDDTLRCEERDEFYKWYAWKRTKQSVHLIDTKNLHAWVTGVSQGKGHSRLNCFTAVLSVDLAFQLLENKLQENKNSENSELFKKPSILIVAPYKPHIAKVNQLIEFEYKSRCLDDLGLIRAGTIHSFQGSEADVVIFDLVIDEPHWKANLFMKDKAVSSELEKMFNVAVTRAKFKLFIVGNYSYCQKRAKDNALGILLKYLLDVKKLHLEDAKKLFPQLTYAPNKMYAGNGNLSSQHIICREDNFDDYFLEDIQQCKQKLIIYSPFIAQERLSRLLPYFADAVKRGRSLTVVTKAISDRGKTELEHYKKCENELRDLGINIIHKKGMHEKLIFVDDSVVWVGSLNALSFTAMTGEIMHRQFDKKLAEEYAKVFGIEHLSEVAQNAKEQICPICGSEMLMAESDSGGFYWTCENKDYTRQTTQQYPHDGIIRCKCGAPQTFIMKTQPRWVCSVNHSHYQRMREGDLKLEKMLALIPKNEQKNVLKYFSDKRKAREAEKPKKKIPKKSEKTKMPSKTIKNNAQISFFD